uniref:Xylulose kinase-1 n=1 Tax=Tanacetum cinerariifolium TaxID=118510 RepID=A0A699JYP0_TANCI|nr:xylulose kinase-1 [Tanacetum cinerariifolium]
MVAYLSKSDASEGFNQIIDFLNGSSIKYALTMNPNIYVSCIKQFWTTTAVKQVNDVTRLQALVDKKKVVVTEATIREVLRLDDAEGVDCLSNEDIFAELARMGYENHPPSLRFTKLSSRASGSFCFVRNVDSTTKFYMYPHFLQLIVRKQVGDLSTHTTKYTSPALTQKEVDEEGDADENVEEVNAGDAAKGDDSVAHGEVLTVTKEPSIPSSTPLTPPPQPPQDIPSTSQVKGKQEKDKIRTKLDKNRKRGKARQCRRPITVKKVGKEKKIQV